MVTIKYRHYRLADNGKPAPTGGFTLAVHRNATTAFVGIARCSKHDAYCKQTGRNIAYKRLKSLNDHITITASELREFIYNRRITLKGFTAAATTKFVNNIQLEDVADELVFQCAMSLAYL